MPTRGQIAGGSTVGLVAAGALAAVVANAPPSQPEGVGATIVGDPVVLEAEAVDVGLPKRELCGGPYPDTPPRRAYWRGHCREQCGQPVDVEFVQGQCPTCRCDRPLGADG